MKDTLKHYGILGMRWGIRKDADRIVSKYKQQARMYKEINPSAVKGSTSKQFDNTYREYKNKEQKISEKYKKKIFNSDGSTKRGWEQQDSYYSEKVFTLGETYEKKLKDIILSDIGESNVENGRDYLLQVFHEEIRM